MIRYRGEITAACSFDGWSLTYAMNVAQAVYQWLESHRELQGTTMYWGLEEVFARAMSVPGSPFAGHVDEYLEALYK